MADFSVLVTLDGTKFAEEALLLLPFLKLIGVTKVQLVSVWEDLGTREAEGRFSQGNQRGEALITAYLQSHANAMQSLGLQIEATIRTGNAAEEVLQVAEQSRPDLILIATHGRTFIDRWRLGSVADKLVRGANCATLVIGPNVKIDLKAYAVRRILAPLDMSEFAEQALPIAAAIARRSGAELELVEVPNVPTAWTADPYAGLDITQAVQWLEEDARDYMSNIELPGVTPEKTVLRFVATAGVGAALLSHLAAKPADLVIMTSHGRHGVTRWAMGSVTDEVLRGPAPVLVLRPGEKDISPLILAKDEDPTA